jgi:SAM-dependent methyltransferase
MPAKGKRLSARAWHAARNAMLDLRYGKFLGGTIRSRYEHLGAFHVANTPYDDLPFLFAAAGVADDDVFVDVGCGKGRVINWLLSHHAVNRIVGIELDPDVCRATAKRLRRFANVEIRCGDATTMLPDSGTVFYLFNPFDEHVLRRFADAFLAAGGGGKRRRIVYYNCKYLEVFESDPRFLVDEIELPSRSHGSALISVA